MNCKIARGLISEYVDGHLGGSKLERFEAHIAICAACALDVEETKDLVASLSSLAVNKSPIDCWTRVRAKILITPQTRPQWWRWAIRPMVAAPTALVAALLALFLLWPGQDSTLANDKTLAPEYAYYIGAHHRAHQPLALVDSDAAFIKAEIQMAGLISGSR